MGQNDQYRHGDHNAICDYCGEKKKASQMRLTWDNAFVCADTCWEPRQPQDFVRGKIDKQRVPPHLNRPDSSDNFTDTTLNGALAKLAATATLTSVSGVAKYTTIGIETDEIQQDASGITGDNVTSSGRIVHWTYVASIAGSVVTLGEPMPYSASNGLKVYIQHDDRFLGTNEVTVGSL